MSVTITSVKGRTRITLFPGDTAKQRVFSLAGICYTIPQLLALLKAQVKDVSVRTPNHEEKRGDIVVLKMGRTLLCNGGDLATQIATILGIKGKGKGKADDDADAGADAASDRMNAGIPAPSGNGVTV